MLIAVILIAAFSIALYWSDAPEVAADGTLTHPKPPLVAYIGLWIMKVKVMIAGVGIAMLKRISGLALRPVLHVLVLMAGTVSALMTAALL